MFTSNKVQQGKTKASISCWKRLELIKQRHKVINKSERVQIQIFKAILITVLFLLYNMYNPFYISWISFLIIYIAFIWVLKM